jgi:VWFA-related protein
VEDGKNSGGGFFAEYRGAQAVFAAVMITFPRRQISCRHGTMRVSSLVALISLLYMSCVPVVAQEAAKLRLGVAVLSGPPKIEMGIEARDRLVMLLNRRKADGKSLLNLEAVALDASSPVAAMADARNKNCEFVLYTRLTDLTSKSDISSPIGVDLPVFHAGLEYQINRVVDGSGFASNSIKAEDSASIRDAIWRALAQVASVAASEIKKGQATPNVPAVGGNAATPAVPLMNPIMDAPIYCKWLPSDIAHAGALAGACQYAISLPEKIPNFVCGQNTARYRGSSRGPSDLISASVRYENGHESYSEVKINGLALGAGAGEPPGLRSTGEFAGNLRAIFNRSNHALFKFSSEGTLGERTAWIFTYDVLEQRVPLWLLSAVDRTIAPWYSGELWIDEKDGSILRFRSVAKDLPQTFPMKSVDLQINYDKIVFGDGTAFVLPVDYTLTNVYNGAETSRNVVQFRNCQKFRATARIIASTEGDAPGSALTAQLAPAASLQKDLEESEAIFAAVSEQALQEGETRRQTEQQQMLNAVTASTLGRLSPVEQQNVQDQAPEASNAPSVISRTDALTAIRVSVNLVQVKVVLRDAKGRAVGNLGKENFRLFDGGKPQIITRFSVEAAEPGVAVEKSIAPGTAQPAPNKIQPAASERDTAYLFDDVHSSPGDMASARAAAARHLNLKAGERAAIFTTSGTVVVDFTSDSEKLLAGLDKLMARGMIPGSDCPPIGYYMADLMVNKRDMDANNVAVAETQECAFQGSGPNPLVQRMATAKALEVLSIGNAESKNALAVLSGVIRRIELMPGQRSIVLVSPGFLAITPEIHIAVMKIIDGAVNSGVVVNAVDARGLYVPGFVAGNIGHAQPARLLLDSDEAQAQGDVMADLASGTGGIFFHNNNNLDEGFRLTADAPEFVYVLGFAPQKLDGKLHKLKVTLNGAPKLEIQARRGYYAIKPAS